MNHKKGRPKLNKPIEELTYTTYQEDITLFKNGLIDSITDEETDIDKETIKKFLNLDLWKQNLFIMYLLNKDKHFTFKAFAELLQINKKELMHAIRDIRNELI